MSEDCNRTVWRSRFLLRGLSDPGYSARHNPPDFLFSRRL
ncbi:hypothetical protein APY03_7295 [Variovorax sp. WDL1]|nr:hypothetical protein APY03_7295 [Variovorax sp. WDL1]